MSAPVREKRAVRLLVSGRVQGVGFRFFVRGLARELALAGRVRNLPDGRVEAEAAGAPEALATFARRIREEGPGRVAEVREQEIAPAPEWDDFAIDRWSS